MPDVIRRGLRLSVGLAICNSVGFMLADSVEGDNVVSASYCCATMHMDARLLSPDTGAHAVFGGDAHSVTKQRCNPCT